MSAPDPQTGAQQEVERLRGLVAGFEDELTRYRQVITAYVREVENGDRFGDLVELVPGLASDDGMYGDVEPHRGGFISQVWFVDGRVS